MTKAPPLIGTARATDRCGACGHPRLRHTDRGLNRCTVMMDSWAPTDADTVPPARYRCPCGHFRERS